MADQADDHSEAGAEAEAGSRAAGTARAALGSRWGKALLAALAVVVLGMAVASVPLFVNPDVDEPRAVDAVVVLAGGGNREDPAVSLVERGYADVVVFSDPGRGSLPFTANQYCNSRNALRVPEGVEQICFDPDPGTTQGEVRAIAALAEERDWTGVMMVASTDQVTRARRLLERCWDGDIVMIGVDHDQSLPIRIAYEWGATLKSYTVNRGC
ncbi:MAG: YdcF family protein [Acidimicrobiia bacterium]|nr:YdcF family protein [Acidimicrobiia bacterium]